MADSSSPQGGFHVAHNFGTKMPVKLWEESISSFERTGLNRLGSHRSMTVVLARRSTQIR
jgi:hypothetical protein